MLRDKTRGDVELELSDWASINLTHVPLSTAPPDDTVVLPSQLRAWLRQISDNETTISPRRPTHKPPSAQRLSSDNVRRSRTTITGRPTDSVDQHAAAAGKRETVSKSGAMNENRRREQNEVMRRRTAVDDASSRPVDHKDVSNA